MGEIKIYLDCKLQMNFYDYIENWIDKKYIDFPVKLIQTNIEKKLKPTVKLKTKKIKIRANIHIIEPRGLVILCYEFMNPTKSQLDLHVFCYRLYGAEFEDMDFTKNIKPEYKEGLTDNERDNSV